MKTSERATTGVLLLRCSPASAKSGVAAGRGNRSQLSSYERRERCVASRRAREIGRPVIARSSPAGEEATVSRHLEVPRLYIAFRYIVRNSPLEFIENFVSSSIHSLDSSNVSRSDERSRINSRADTMMSPFAGDSVN